MSHKNLFFLLIPFCCGVYSSVCFSDNVFSLSLSTEKRCYYEEEEITLFLTIENLSGEVKQIDIQYLQPVENMSLFVGGTFHLFVEFNNNLVENFTNHIPPEPKPGIMTVPIKAGETILWKIPFPYYYYPFSLPGQFRVKLQYLGIMSNEVVFNIEKSQGTRKNESLNINADFSQGQDYPFGWQTHNKKIVWEREKHVLVFHLDKKTAEGEGLWMYSLFHETQSPSELNLYTRIKSSGPEIIIFVEGWGLVGNRKRCIERNECFVKSGNEWGENSFNVVFTKPEVKWLRIKLYAYLKPGTVYFDSIALNEK